MSCEIRIGTSGYHYKHWRIPIYPTKISSDEMLREFYAKTFDTVELNDSFYRLPHKTQFSLTSGGSGPPPANFVFAVKASRTLLTHQKKLKDSEIALQNFLPQEASQAMAKLGTDSFPTPTKVTD